MMHDMMGAMGWGMGPKFAVPTVAISQPLR